MDVSLMKLISSFQLAEDGSVVPKDSYFFSNLSVSATLDMLANGAEGKQRANLLSHFLGRTLYWVNEITPLTHEFLRLTGYAGGPDIKLAKRIVLYKSVTLKPAFLEAIERFYKPKIYRFDVEFGNSEALKKEVNKWSQEETGGLIDDCLGGSAIQADTRLSFASVLGFEGRWVEPFKDAGVKQFTSLNGRVVSMPFMTTNGKQYVKQFDNYKLLSVPYQQNEASNFSMLFYLPQSIQSFEDLLLFIGTEESVLMRENFPKEQVPVGNILIPKFELNIYGPLQFMDGDKPYDFPLMANSPNGLYSNEGTLRSFLKINETGIRAFGVCNIPVKEKRAEPCPRSQGKTGGLKDGSLGSTVIPADTSLVSTSLTKSHEIDFIADRPFIFFIRDNKYGRMLFSGAIINPVGICAPYKPSRE